MSAKIIDGKKISESLIEKIKIEVEKLKKTTGKFPGLATILIGNNPASLSYVSLKIKKAKQIGFKEQQINLKKDINEKALLSLIEDLNQDPDTHGILVQLPLPLQISLKKVIHQISPLKDVDGFHPLNLGSLLTEYQEEGLYPCTPKGIIKMIKATRIETIGKNVVVLGRSNLVGKPAAIMLLEKNLTNATVSVVHSATRDYQSYTKKADILIACMGRPKFIQKNDLKEGVCVIDVGVNKVGENPQTGKAILKGDVNFETIKEIASHITPVPGGVGPMTIATLMENTLIAFKNTLK